MKRRLYLIAATVLALAAGLLTLRAQHTVPVVVATHDLHAGVVVSADDVHIVSMHTDSVPSGAMTALDQVTGRYVAWPLTAGEPVLAGSLSSTRSGGAATAGLDVPAGYSAIAVPVQPAAAVGGMLSPGDHVDVYAAPAHPDAGSGASFSPAQATLIGHDVLVIQLRTDQGQALDTSQDAGSGGTSVHGLNFGSGKLGSVVLAVPNTDVAAYAGAISTEVMYLSLSVS